MIGSMFESGDHLFGFVPRYFVFEFVPAHDPRFALECDEPLVPENANAAPQPWRARKIPLPNVRRSAHILSPTVISDPKLTLDFDRHHALLDSKYRRAARYRT